MPLAHGRHNMGAVGDSVPLLLSFVKSYSSRGGRPIDNILQITVYGTGLKTEFIDSMIGPTLTGPNRPIDRGRKGKLIRGVR